MCAHATADARFEHIAQGRSSRPAAAKRHHVPRTIALPWSAHSNEKRGKAYARGACEARQRSQTAARRLLYCYGEVKQPLSRTVSAPRVAALRCDTRILLA